MKKILALAVGMLLIPFTAFGMQMMSEGDMDSITGQSGVAISIDNIQIFTASTDELWFETNLGAADTAAAVGLVYGDESADYLFLNKIAAPGALGATNAFDTYGTLVGGVDADTNNAMLRGDYSALAADDGTGSPTDLKVGITNKGPRQNPAVLSIRVSQTNDDYGVFGGKLVGPDFEGTTTDEPGAYIEIGLPTIEIYSAAGSVDELQIYVLGDAAYDGTNPVGSGQHAYSLGTVWTSGAGSTTAILGGRIGITSLGQVPGEYTSSTYEDEVNDL